MTYLFDWKEWGQKPFEIPALPKICYEILWFHLMYRCIFTESHLFWNRQGFMVFFTPNAKNGFKRSEKIDKKRLSLPVVYLLYGSGYQWELQELRWDNQGMRKATECRSRSPAYQSGQIECAWMSSITGINRFGINLRLASRQGKQICSKYMLLNDFEQSRWCMIFTAFWTGFMICVYMAVVHQERPFD